jgi:hypothetical protein
MFTTRELLLLRLELRQCFSAKRIPTFVLMFLAGIFLVVQESELSPFVVVFFTVFAILESQFNNILYRSPHELEALSMFPISWDRVVLVKNVATIILAGIVMFIAGMTILYFSPKPFGFTAMIEALMYASTIIFPLLHVGNTESLLSPRKSPGWNSDDLVQAAGMFLFVFVLSLPYIIFVAIVKMPLLSLVYAGGTAWYWYRRSIRKTASTIERKKTELCTNR